jgi:Fe-S-cluster containining protein
MAFECQSCGACCVNPLENQRAQRTDYVPVETSARLLARSDLLRKYVGEDVMGAPHLRMLAGGRCAALRGALGRKVGCAIYHHRPRACRTVQPGDADCLRSRADHLSHDKSPAGHRS